MKISKYYLSQIIIDVCVIALGVFNLMFAELFKLDANAFFYVEMGIYGLLELIEYFSCDKKQESIWLFIISLVAAYTCIFLRNYESRYVLAGTTALWTIMLLVTKIMALNEIDKKYVNLFVIRFTLLCMFTFLAIVISFNFYFETTTVAFLAGILFIFYGFTEIMADFISYLSTNPKFIKE